MKDRQVSSRTRRRVLLGPADSASFATRLARGLADQGLDCWVLNQEPHMYHSDLSCLGRARPLAANWLQHASRMIRGGFFSRVAAHFIRKVAPWCVFVWSLWAVDAVVFISCTRSFVRGHLDLWVYRLLRKRVIWVYLGTDSRPRYMHGWHHDILDPAKKVKAARRLAQRVRRQRTRIRQLARLSDFVVDNPLCGHFQERPFINWFYIGFPHDERAFGGLTDGRKKSEGEPLRIMHCPSHPHLKGTDRIEAVINKLRENGANITYTRITGMPRAEVLKRLSECDLVIDELYSDSPMAGFASEAAAFGKPAIVGGYGWEHLRKRLPPDVIPPNLLCHPDELETMFRRVSDDRDYCRRVGNQAYNFVNGFWQQEAVARRFLRLLGDDDIPTEWWCDPKTITFWHGLGAPEEHRRQVILALSVEADFQELVKMLDSQSPHAPETAPVDVLHPPSDNLQTAREMA
jgi:hypothetical protein